MKITILPTVFEKLSPQFSSGFILATHLDNAILHKEAKNLLDDIEQYVRLTFHKETFATHKMISPWESAKQHFKGKAHHYHTSVEKLLKTVLARKSVATKNVAHNLVHYLSLKHIIPMTLDDADKIVGNVTLSISTGRQRIGLKKIPKDVLLYHDESKKKQIIGTMFGYKKVRRTKVGPKTKTILIQINAMPPITGKEFEILMKETAELFASFTDGHVKTLILNKSNKSGMI